MPMFRSKRKTEFVSPSFYKDWSRADSEIEGLGRRLDAVRQAIRYLEEGKVPENHWGLKHWRSIEQVMLRRWKHTVRMKDVGMRQVTKRQEGPDIDYSWWEGSEEVVMRMPLFDNLAAMFTEKFGISNGSLDRAWEMAIQNKIEMARKGLA